MSGLVLSVEPTDEPLSLADAKLHLKVSGSDDDDLITSLITAARQQVENVLRRQLITATYILYLESFPAKIRLPRPPVQLDTAGGIGGITYVDNAGAPQTLDASLYVVDDKPTIALVEPAYQESWPAVRGFTNDIAVTYDAGYGAVGSDVPQAILSALKLLLGDLYTNREAQLLQPVTDNLTVVRLLMPYRVWMEV